MSRAAVTNAVAWLHEVLGRKAPPSAAGAHLDYALRTMIAEIAAHLSRLDSETRSLTATAINAQMLAQRTTSAVNQMVADADSAAEAVESLARELSNFERRSRDTGYGEADGEAIETLRNEAAQITDRSFGLTLRTVRSRSTAKELADSLDELHRKAQMIQILTAEVSQHIEDLSSGLAQCSEDAP